MIAAWRAASLGANVLLLEKDKKPGIKILISGGGKCNITNGNDIELMLKQFEKNESQFLKFAFHTFTNTQLLSHLHQQGVETYARDNGKVFPKSHNAEDVVDALMRMMLSVGVTIQVNAPVKNIAKSNNETFIVTTDSGDFLSRNVILATGGISYKKTGTTGDGYQWAKQFGHTIIPIRPALAPMYLSPTPSSLWQGTPIRDCTLLALCNNNVVTKWNGDLLFTHLGISGPAVLEVSRKAFVAMEAGYQVLMYVDFFPELSAQKLEAKLIADITSNSNKTVITLLERYVPQRLAEYVAMQSNVAPRTKLHQLKKQERLKIIETLKFCYIGTVQEIPLDRGEVTAGGIALNEINSTTMESKLVSGLYLCGEILDIAGPVGGYNLQAAFSTGYVAGKNAAKRSSPL